MFEILRRNFLQFSKICLSSDEEGANPTLRNIAAGLRTSAQWSAQSECNGRVSKETFDCL